MPEKEAALEVEGVVTQALANTRFRVKLDGDHQIIAHVAGKMRKNFIRIVPGDKVRVELSPYDLTKGRITYRELNALFLADSCRQCPAEGARTTWLAAIRDRFSSGGLDFFQANFFEPVLAKPAALHDTSYCVSSAPRLVARTPSTIQAHTQRTRAGCPFQAPPARLEQEVVP